MNNLNTEMRKKRKAMRQNVKKTDIIPAETKTKKPKQMHIDLPSIQ